MRTEVKKANGFDITSFETMDVNGKSVLKGGFSAVYDEKLVSGGLTLIKIVINKNDVAGCACSA